MSKQLAEMLSDIEQEAIFDHQRAEAMELVLICAQDIVNAWPTLTMRTLGSMTKRMETLKQALEAAK